MVGQKGKGLLLLSGGFDSPVAGLLMMRQGFGIDAIHFSLEPVTDDAAERKCMELARVLGLERIFVAKVGEEMAQIAAKCTRRYYFVLSKRFMVRVSERVARKEGHGWLLTGENLGQVSSQTLQNLTIIDSAAGLPVLRPLLGFDKQEIIAISREGGMYEISKGPEICDVLGPETPSTAASLPAILEEESKIDCGALADAAIMKLKEHVLSPSKEVVA